MEVFRMVRLGVLALVLAASAACADDPPPDVGPTPVDIAGLDVGDCFEEPEGGAPEGQVTEATELVVVPCDEPFDGEVYAVTELPQDDYPGEEAVREAARADCAQQLETRLGRPVTTGDGFYPITPTRTSWEQGADRAVTCVVLPTDADAPAEVPADVPADGAPEPPAG